MIEKITNSLVANYQLQVENFPGYTNISIVFSVEKCISKTQIEINTNDNRSEIIYTGSGWVRLVLVLGY